MVSFHSTEYPRQMYIFHPSTVLNTLKCTDGVPLLMVSHSAEQTFHDKGNKTEKLTHFVFNCINLRVGVPRQSDSSCYPCNKASSPAADQHYIHGRHLFKKLQPRTVDMREMLELTGFL